MSTRDGAREENARMDAAASAAASGRAADEAKRLREALTGLAGVTLRDLFAGLALLGSLANPRVGERGENVIEESWLTADAMLIQRAKSTEVIYAH